MLATSSQQKVNLDIDNPLHTERIMDAVNEILTVTAATAQKIISLTLQGEMFFKFSHYGTEVLDGEAVLSLSKLDFKQLKNSSDFTYALSGDDGNAIRIVGSCLVDADDKLAISVSYKNNVLGISFKNGDFRREFDVHLSDKTKAQIEILPYRH